MQLAVRRIDAHQHFWAYTPQDFGWIGEGMEAIRRNFLPEDLQRELAASHIDGAITVQVCQTVPETEWLLDMAARYAFLRGVVGWVQLTDATVADIIAPLAANTRLKGLRHILQDEPDDCYMLRPDFNAGIARLRGFNLAYDILIYERHLPQTIEFVDRHPDQVFVLDHIAKPRIRGKILSPWRENIRELARRANVYCKLSGAVTEANWNNWTAADLQPYLDTALEAFGPRRLMFGSDWPVLLLAGSYLQWTQVVNDSIAALSDDERERILGGTAIEAYRL
ncbi:MAG: amidohydrolase family protein [Bryobacteraceae bacterium]